VCADVDPGKGHEQCGEDRDGSEAHHEVAGVSSISSRPWLRCSR
jgi:hypothetical protein